MTLIHLALIALMLFLFIYVDLKFAYQKEYFESAKEPTIFVSVASYKDKDCQTTISQMISNARFPYRLFLGICQQHDPEDPSCFVPDTIRKRFPKFPVENIRTVYLRPRDAIGPMYARRLCSKLYNGEDFYLQIDSHTDFVKNWDEKLINQMKALPPKSVLSTYPLQRGDADLVRNTRVPVFMQATKGKNGLPIFKSKKVHNNTGTFHRTCSVAAGFVCLPREAVKLPLWPYLPNIFQGEEVIMAAMLYSNGFDVYCPVVNLCSHNYTRTGEPKFWDDKKTDDPFWTVQRESEAFARRLLCIDFPIIRPGSGEISLGTARKMNQFWKRVYEQNQ